MDVAHGLGVGGEVAYAEVLARRRGGRVADEPGGGVSAAHACGRGRTHIANGHMKRTGLSGLSAKYSFHRCSNSGPSCLSSSSLGLSLMAASTPLEREDEMPMACKMLDDVLVREQTLAVLEPLLMPF